MRAQRGLVMVASGLLAVALTVVALVVLTGRDENGHEEMLLETLQEHERTDPEFAGCVNQLKGEGMELVMRVDSTCGDVFTASQCSVQCHTAALAMADAMGCCWPRLISGFSKVQPSAAHAWHSWAFNLENLCGVSLAGQCDAQSYDEEKTAADSALGVAQQALLKAQQERSAAESARLAAIAAQDEAKKLQEEMAEEEKQFQTMRRHFRLSRADASRAVLVERMVHNSVKKDLQQAWGIHKDIDHAGHVAAKIAAGTQVQQQNARALLKSAHAAKKSVYAMAKLAAKAKKAAYRLHKLAMQDLVRAERVEKRAKLQREIAKKAGRDVARQLKDSEKIIRKSKEEQGKAKKLWGALEDEQKGFADEHKEATDGVADEEALDKKMQAEIAEAEEHFEEFGKEAKGVEDAVSHAEDLAEHAATISAQSENLLEQTKTQQAEIDRERGWLMQQQAQVLAGRRGIATLEGQLDGLKRKYYSLRRAFSGLEYQANHIEVPQQQAGSFVHVHREGYVNPGGAHLVLPMPPRSSSHVFVQTTSYGQTQPIFENEE